MEEFKDTREGFLTPEEEQILDDLYEAKGIIEALDGMVIRIADNKGLQQLKSKIPNEMLPTIYEVVDSIFEALKPVTTK